jgi:hypothetical protein
VAAEYTIVTSAIYGFTGTHQGNTIDQLRQVSAGGTPEHAATDDNYALHACHP